jgi:hypothetical protein
MTIQQNLNGTITVSTVIFNQHVKRIYSGYSINEIRVLFAKVIKEYLK